MDVSRQAPAQPRANTLLNTVKIRRRAIGGDNDLPIVVNQCVEGMEKLFLSGFLARDKLDVVNHQHIEGAELLLEGHGVFIAKRPNELVHELIG